MTKYKITPSTEFSQQWQQEARWSRTNWGTAHAKKYFSEFRSQYRKLLQTDPHIFVNPNLGLARGYGYIKHKGHYILFFVDEATRTVKLENLYGRNRFHELQNQLTRTPTEQSPERRDYDRDDDRNR